MRKGARNVTAARSPWPGASFMFRFCRPAVVAAAIDLVRWDASAPASRHRPPAWRPVLSRGRPQVASLRQHLPAGLRGEHRPGQDHNRVRVNQHVASTALGCICTVKPHRAQAVDIFCPGAAQIGSTLHCTNCTVVQVTHGGRAVSPGGSPTAVPAWAVCGCQLSPLSAPAVLGAGVLSLSRAIPFLRNGRARPRSAGPTAVSSGGGSRPDPASDARQFRVQDVHCSARPKQRTTLRPGDAPPWRPPRSPEARGDATSARGFSGRFASGPCRAASPRCVVRSLRAYAVALCTASAGDPGAGRSGAGASAGARARDRCGTRITERAGRMATHTGGFEPEPARPCHSSDLQPGRPAPSAQEGFRRGPNWPKSAATAAATAAATEAARSTGPASSQATRGARNPGAASLCKLGF